MTQPKAQASEKRPTIPGLPGYLTVGSPARVRSSRAKIGVEHLRKMFDWWNTAQPQLKDLKADSLGIPAIKLAQEFGLQVPTNGNSFRANLQRNFDGMSIEGKTMFLSLRGAEGDRFKVTQETMVWFKPVLLSERTTGHRAR